MEQDREQPRPDIGRDRQTAATVKRQAQGTLGQFHRSLRAAAEAIGETEQRLIMKRQELLDSGPGSCLHGIAPASLMPVLQGVGLTTRRARPKSAPTLPPRQDSLAENRGSLAGPSLKIPLVQDKLRDSRERSCQRCQGDARHAACPSPAGKTKRPAEAVP